MNALRSNDTSLPAQGTRIDLHHLRFAITAADCGSFREAAELLSVRHSLVSRAIRDLEHFIGVALFERSSTGVSPTLAGRDVLRTARMVLEQVDSLIVAGKLSRRGERGHLAIGFCTSMSAGNLRATVIDFKKRFPEVELTTAERSRSRLTTALRSGALDVLIATGEIHSLNNRIAPLWSERILVSLQKDHPLAAREVVYWTDLRNETVLLSQYDPGRELEDLLISKLVSSEDRPKIERHDVSRGIIKSLVSMGLGISLVMESDTGASFAGLAYRELRDGTGSSRIGFSAHWRADNDNPALHSFLKLLAERYSGLAGRTGFP